MMQISNKIDRLKKAIDIEIEKERWNSALSLIETLASMLYYVNNEYYDETLEKQLSFIVQNAFGLQSDMKPSNHNIALFYDGFGLNERGLVRNYLPAISKSLKTIYITNSAAKDSIPDVKRILSENDGECLFVNSDNDYLSRIWELIKIIKEKGVNHFFFYSTPYDVVGVSLMCYFAHSVKRYLINLTDHAFWLGASFIDVCIEYRDYGASISHYYRKIPENRIAKIPFYPVIKKDVEFQGYPFPLEKNQKVVFSGGNLYKTFGAGNLYYKYVDYLLQNHDDVILWYAGKGDQTELSKIQKKYPNRVYFTKERQDLYQVLQHCYFFLNTYPLCGGLMYQYAAAANRIPLTLKYGPNTEGLLIDQDKLGIEFDEYDSFINEMNRILTDQNYKKQKELALSNALITPLMFDREVSDLINKNKFGMPINFREINTSDFVELYSENLSQRRINELFFNKKNFTAARYFPFEFFCGFITKIQNRISKIVNTCVK